MNKLDKTLRHFGWLKTNIDPRTLWHRYVVALLAIVALLVVVHLGQTIELRAGINDAAVVNHSGRQRMLSQRILYFATRWVDTPTAEIRREIEDAVDQFEAAHTALVNRPDLPEAVHRLYYDPAAGSLDSLSLEFMALARALLAAPPEARESGLRTLAAIGEQRLLSSLNHVVSAFEADSNGKAMRLQRLQQFALFAMGFILLLESLLIFWPAHIAVNTTLSALETRSHDLEARSAELGRKNSALEEAQDQLLHAALHDPLTGLANRKRLSEVLNRRLEPGSTPLAVLFIDLDGFKSVNDRHGHAAGDQLLQIVADRLRAAVGTADLVARIGGDEFVVLQDLSRSVQAPSTLAEAIVGVLSASVTLDAATVRIGASVGYVRHDGGAMHPDRLIDCADAALYQAKRLGKGRVVSAGPNVPLAIGV